MNANPPSTRRTTLKALKTQKTLRKAVRKKQDPIRMFLMSWALKLNTHSPANSRNPPQVETIASPAPRMKHAFYNKATINNKMAVIGKKTSNASPHTHRDLTSPSASSKTGRAWTTSAHSKIKNSLLLI